MDEDDVLMERAKRGDASAFDLLVRRHQGRLQRFATRMAGGDAARGADVAVGAFLRLWETRASFLPEGKVAAWLIQVAYRMILDEARRSRPSASLAGVADAEVLHGRVERTAMAQAVRDAVTDLPETHRAVIVLSVYEGMSHDEIGRALEIPAGTVASRKNSALKTLRRRLAAWDELP